MTAAISPRERLGRARKLMQSASGRWSAADSRAHAEAQALLESTVEHLRAANDEIRGMEQEGARELIAAVDDLRRRIAEMSRWVDSSLAFCRGMALRTGAIAEGPGVSSPRRDLGQV